MRFRWPLEQMYRPGRLNHRRPTSGDVSHSDPCALLTDPGHAEIAGRPPEFLKLLVFRSQRCLYDHRAIGGGELVDETAHASGNLAARRLSHQASTVTVVPPE